MLRRQIFSRNSAGRLGKTVNFSSPGCNRKGLTFSTMILVPLVIPRPMISPLLSFKLIFSSHLITEGTVTGAGGVGVGAVAIVVESEAVVDLAVDRLILPTESWRSDAIFLAVFEVGYGTRRWRKRICWVKILVICCA